jgi:pyruvate/2-oxoglutarate dehydrogenase complex dihydrolipoamide acyltransferase (E2) component
VDVQQGSDLRSSPQGNGLSGMASELRIPKLGMSVTEVTLLEWLVADGSAVTAGMPLYSVETDKSTSEVEASESGTLKITGSVDTVYAVGALVGMIE